MFYRGLQPLQKFRHLPPKKQHRLLLTPRTIHHQRQHLHCRQESLHPAGQVPAVRHLDYLRLAGPDLGLLLPQELQAPVHRYNYRKPLHTLCIALLKTWQSALSGTFQNGHNMPVKHLSLTQMKTSKNLHCQNRLQYSSHQRKPQQAKHQTMPWQPFPQQILNLAAQLWFLQQVFHYRPQRVQPIHLVQEDTSRLP